MKSLNLKGSEGSRINGLMSLDDAAALIRAGAPLAIAGREAALDALPPGQWIGGTTPYFLTAEGGEIIDETRVFVTDFSGLGAVRVVAYDEHHLDKITEDAPENGFALAIIPFQSTVHQRFAKEAGTYPMAFLKPTVGWIAGFDLGEADAVAHVYDGVHATRHANRAVVLHVELPEGQWPNVEIVNIFEADGQTVRFEEASFSPEKVIVGGMARNFAEYVRERGLEGGQLPLVGNFGGARINASIRAVEGDKVHLYAPVFPGINYAFAKPVGDYAEAFAREFASHSQEGAVFSCNCILNYLYGDLEGKVVAGAAGPVTFGEIAYSLVNQTLVQVRAG
jgi:hypothetical protein